MTQLNVAEVFGPTVQGEGPHAGCTAAFIRLSGCNLSCRWCDTPYTWDWTRYDQAVESVAWRPDLIADLVHDMPLIERVVLTGGEPLVQQRRLPALLERLIPPVDVETNGTIKPTTEVADLVAMFVVSPKIIPSAAQRMDKANRPVALHHFAWLADQGRAVFKYVAQDSLDLDAIANHVAALRLSPHQVYVMPEGRSAKDVVAATKRIADPVVRHGWRLGTRLHVLAWGDERGR